jgi:hypothetical protein
MVFITLLFDIRRGERSQVVCAVSSMLAFPLRGRVTMEPEDQRVASTKRPIAATSVAVNK